MLSRWLSPNNLSERNSPLQKVGRTYLSERGVAWKLSSEMVSSHSPLGEGHTSAQRPRHSSREVGPAPTLTFEPTRLESQIVMTFYDDL